MFPTSVTSIPAVIDFISIVLFVIVSYSKDKLSGIKLTFLSSTNSKEVVVDVLSSPLGVTLTISTNGVCKLVEIDESPSI
jgi:hypothetical protein